MAMTTRHYTPAYRNEAGELVAITSSHHHGTTSYAVAKNSVEQYNATIDQREGEKFVFLAYRDVPDWAEHTHVESADFQAED